MTKSEIVANVASKTDLSREVVMAAVEGFMKEVRTAVSDGNSVFLRGFGTFEPKHRAEKKCRNIKARTEVIVPAHVVAHFKPSKDFLTK